MFKKVSTAYEDGVAEGIAKGKAERMAKGIIKGKAKAEKILQLGC